MSSLMNRKRFLDCFFASRIDFTCVATTLSTGHGMSAPVNSSNVLCAQPPEMATTEAVTMQ